MKCQNWMLEHFDSYSLKIQTERGKVSEEHAQNNNIQYIYHHIIIFYITTVLVLWQISVFFFSFIAFLSLAVAMASLKKYCRCEPRLIRHLSSWFLWCMDTEIAHTVVRDLHLGTFGLSFSCSRCRPCMLDNVCSLSFEEIWLLLKKVQHSRCAPEVFIFPSLTLDPCSVTAAKNIYFPLTLRTSKTNLHRFVKSRRSSEN